MRRIETIVLVLALGFYAWFLAHFGFSRVFGYVRIVGWGLGLTIALESLARIANTLGWRVTIRDYPGALGFPQLFGARVAGEAVDYVTPSAQLGGQFVMALMVRRKLRMPAGLATVAVAALAEAIGQIVFVGMALMISLELVRMQERLHLPILGGFALAVALAAGFFFVQTKKPFSHILHAAEKLDPRIDTDEIEEAAEDADAVLLDFYANHRVRLILSCLCYLAAWSFGPLEIYILLRLLHQPASLEIAMMVEAIGLLIERATFLIPAKLVSQEGGKALILAMLGYPAGVGFAVGFLRRLKEMVWVMIGLLSLMFHRMVVEKSGDTNSVEAAGQVLEIQRVQGE
ncbi:MAG TPA: lysylphosphatidylglycerol synthase domain-containing protein [Candidatus Binataceae bacterium]